jgi:hypothetical protein
MHVEALTLRLLGRDQDAIGIARFLYGAHAGFEVGASLALPAPPIVAIDK